MIVVLNIMIRQRLKRSTRKLSTTFFRTLHDDRSADAVDPNACTAVDRLGSYSYYRSKSLLQPVSPSIRNCSAGNSQHRRFYSTQPLEDFPLLTHLSKRMRPKIFSGIKFLLMNFLLIRPQLDQEFSLKEFLNTTNKVVHAVSNRLATCDYDALEEMVTPHVFDQIKRNLPNFTERQREVLATELEDVAVCYLDEVKIDDSDSGTQKQLQIVTVHHVMKGAAELRRLFGDFPPTPFPTEEEQTKMKELQQRAKTLDGFVTNFSFSRTYNVETGTADNWIINGLNIYARKLEF